MKEGDPQTHDTTCAARVTKSKVIGWHGSEILRHKESLARLTKSQGKILFLRNYTVIGNYLIQLN